MKLPIPDDWDGESFFCVKIEWPDSPLYTAILTGFLAMMVRGRFWDERTGSIKDAQAIGRVVFDMNMPYKYCGDCNGDQPEDVDENLIGIIGGCVAMECSLPYGALRWENGALQYRYCGEWYDVMGERLLGDTPPIDEIYTTPDGTYSACGKAGAIVDYLLAVGNDAWDNRNNDPITAWGNMKAEYPGVLSMGYTLNAVIAAFDIEVATDLSDGWYGPELFDVSTWESILCRLAAELEDTNTLPDKDSLFKTVENIIDQQWPLDPLAQAFWWNTYKAIGENDVRNQGLAGATDTERECDCPNLDPLGPTDPNANGWYLSRAVERYSPYTAYNTPVCVKSAVESDAYGVVFFAEWTGTVSDIKRMGPASAVCGAYDFAGWGDTSDQLESGGQKYLYAVGSQAAMAEVLSGETYTYLDDANYGNAPAIGSPPVAFGEVVASGFFADNLQTDGDVKITLRYLFNTNSPNHP